MKFKKRKKETESRGFGVVNGGNALASFESHKVTNYFFKSTAIKSQRKMGWSVLGQGTKDWERGEVKRDFASE